MSAESAVVTTAAAKGCAERCAIMQGSLHLHERFADCMDTEERGERLTGALSMKPFVAI